MTRLELLKLIGDGEYGSAIPDDDVTSEILKDLVQEGLVRSEPCRIDDFFYLTEVGKQELPYR